MTTPIRAGWNSGTGPGRAGDGCAYTLAFPALRIVLYAR